MDYYKAIGGIELVEKPQTPLTEDEISELKQCHVLILDNIFPVVKNRPHVLSLEIVLDIIEYRYTFGKIMVIVECDTAILVRLKTEIIYKILKNSDHIHLTTLDDTEAALSKLKSILGNQKENNMLMDKKKYFCRN